MGVGVVDYTITAHHSEYDCGKAEEWHDHSLTTASDALDMILYRLSVGGDGQTFKMFFGSGTCVSLFFLFFFVFFIHIFYTVAMPSTLSAAFLIFH